MSLGSARADALSAFLDSVLPLFGGLPPNFAADVLCRFAAELHRYVHRAGLSERGLVACLYHAEGCSPSDDYREPCDCDAVVIEPGVGAIVRPRGVSGCSIDDVLAARREREKLS